MGVDFLVHRPRPCRTLAMGNPGSATATNLFLYACFAVPRGLSCSFQTACAWIDDDDSLEEQFTWTKNTGDTGSVSTGPYMVNVKT